MEVRIILNRIKTPDGTILTSHHRHDYQSYTDKNGLEYMIDGGNDYLRRNTHDSAPYEELSVFSDAPFEIIRKSYHRGGRGKDGKQPLIYTLICEMNDEWLRAAIVYNEEREMGNSFANEMYKKEQEYRKLNNIKIDE